VMAPEAVLVVPRSAVPHGCQWRGVRKIDLTVLLALIGRTGEYRPRPEMEQDPAWKQVIPYLILRDGDQYFLMRRTRAGADQRLHDRWSIGVGGHLNPGDGDLLAGLRREWAEELEAAFEPEFTFVGLLNDDDTDVGRVHLGAVFVADAAGRSVSIRETDKLDGRFATRDDVAAVHDGLESWSVLVFDHLEDQHTPADRSAS